MRKFFLTATLTTAAFMAGCGAGEEKKASNSQPVTVNDHVIGKPISSGNITIYPVSLASMHREVKTPQQSQPQPQTFDDVISLQEAKAQKSIEIREAEGGMQVDSVVVTNNGTKKVLLMTGELLLGGHQDRVVGADTLIEPGKTVNVPVFCVEAGRSTGPTDVFEPTEQSVPLSVKTAAIMGEQEGVWNNVAGFNAAAGITNRSVSTVNGGLSTEKVKARIKTDYDEVWTKLSGEKNVVGAVFVIDGKIRSLEVFGANNIFKGGMPTILRGALSEAAVSQIDANKAGDISDVAEFFRTSMRRVTRETNRNGGSGSIMSSRMAGYVMPSKGTEPMMLHGTFIHTGK